MVLAGGAGERLYPLTRERAKPARYKAARIASSTSRSATASTPVFDTFSSRLQSSAHRMGWSVVDELGEFIEILSPQKRVGEHWYSNRRTPYQNLYSILRENPKQLIVLSGDHVYKMDYAKMLRPMAPARPLRPSTSHPKKRAGSAS